MWLIGRTLAYYTRLIFRWTTRPGQISVGLRGAVIPEIARAHARAAASTWRHGIGRTRITSGIRRRRGRIGVRVRGAVDARDRSGLALVLPHFARGACNCVLPGNEGVVPRQALAVGNCIALRRRKRVEWAHIALRGAGGRERVRGARRALLGGDRARRRGLEPGVALRTRRRVDLGIVRPGAAHLARRIPGAQVCRQVSLEAVAVGLPRAAPVRSRISLARATHAARVRGNDRRKRVVPAQRARLRADRGLVRALHACETLLPVRSGVSHVALARRR